MKKKEIGTICFVFLLIFVLLCGSSLVAAQPSKETSPKGFINLQFSITISWNVSQTVTPISPGETRKVNLDIAYAVNKGLFGGFLLHLLEGKSFPILLSLKENLVWCEAWVVPETITGVVSPDEINIQPSVLFIHLNNDAPTNHTLGEIQIRSTINDMKGPFQFFTLIHGYEQTATLTFITGPQ